MKFFFVLVMSAVILLSNSLVDKPINDFVTWAAFTYPVAFLVTDLANRKFGRETTLSIMSAGFILGFLLTALASIDSISTMRIALASSTAFLTAQFLNVQVFHRLRHLAWWQTPMISSFFGSIVDTALFFWIAFSAYTFGMMPDGNTWALEPKPLLGVFADQPLWVTLAIVDFLVKLLMIPLLLWPYRAVQRRIFAPEQLAY